MNTYKSIVDEKILKNFSAIRGRSLMNHVANSYSIEMAIGLAALFCPEVVEEDGCYYPGKPIHFRIISLTHVLDIISDCQPIIRKVDECIEITQLENTIT